MIEIEGVYLFTYFHQQVVHILCYYKIIYPLCLCLLEVFEICHPLISDLENNHISYATTQGMYIYTYIHTYIPTYIHTSIHTHTSIVHYYTHTRTFTALSGLGSASITSVILTPPMPSFSLSLR